MVKDYLKVILLANWGIGKQILDVLHSDSRVSIHSVISGKEQGSPDAWRNCVYMKTNQLGYDFIDWKSVCFDDLSRFSREDEVDLLIVHAYKKILPPSVFNSPRLGTVNIHPSLLPAYRGVHPTLAVLKNKEKETGITCHFIDEGVDTGNIICQQRIDIAPDDNRETLIEKLKLKVKPLMQECIDLIINGNKGTPQNEWIINQPFSNGSGVY